MQHIYNVSKFYNKNAESYAAQTQALNMTQYQDLFASKLPPDARVLDVGCGAGRDLKYFKEKGFNPIGIDISERLIPIAIDYSGCDVIMHSVLELDSIDLFDGIWESAALLHLTDEEFPVAIKNIYSALKQRGVFCCQIKEGEEGKIDQLGRFMNYHQQDHIRTILIESGFKVIEEWVAPHSIPGRNENFLGFLASKQPLAD